MKLRPYQKQAITDARNSLRQGNKDICICLSVGSGKSLIAKNIIELAKGKKIGFFSHRTILIVQIKKYFDNLDGYDIDFGTVQKYCKNKTGLYDLVIKDEAFGHNSKLKANINSKFLITLSGTPITDDGYPLDFDDIVSGVQLPELIKMGYAKKIKVLSVSKIDTSKLKKQGNDFNKKQAFAIMDKSEIKKDITNVYKNHAMDRKTIIFAVDTNHCEKLKDEFISDGINVDTMHSKKHKKENDNVMTKFENDELNILISVDMLSVGVDIPSVNCVLFARPMRSIPLFIQCVGRATRINPKKPNDNALIIDCGSVLENTSHHPMQMLDFNKSKDKKKVKEHCNQPMIILSKTNKMINELTYMQTTIYKCNVCNVFETKEDMKVVNMQFCQKCENQLTEKNITMTETPKALEFNIKCENCGADNVQRSILLSDKELLEITHIENLNSNDDWIKIEAIIKDEVKKAGYKWQYKDRIMEHLANKRFSSEYVLEQIEVIKRDGRKISKLMFI